MSIKTFIDEFHIDPVFLPLNRLNAFVGEFGDVLIDRAVFYEAMRPGIVDWPSDRYFPAKRQDNHVLGDPGC